MNNFNNDISKRLIFLLEKEVDKIIEQKKLDEKIKTPRTDFASRLICYVSDNNGVFFLSGTGFVAEIEGRIYHGYSCSEDVFSSAYNYLVGK